MARTVNRIERISEDFGHLDQMAQADIVAELFTRLDSAHAEQAMRLMAFWCKRQAREAGSAIPALMKAQEVRECGELALAKVEGRKQ